jgi:hypothetical protein
MFPEQGLVYDYMLDDAGISTTEKGDEIEDENAPQKEVR